VRLSVALCAAARPSTLPLPAVLTLSTREHERKLTPPARLCVRTSTSASPPPWAERASQPGSSRPCRWWPKPSYVYRHPATTPPFSRFNTTPNGRARLLTHYLAERRPPAGQAGKRRSRRRRWPLGAPRPGCPPCGRGKFTSQLPLRPSSLSFRSHPMLMVLTLRSFTGGARVRRVAGSRLTRSQAGARGCRRRRQQGRQTENSRMSEAWWRVRRFVFNQR